MRKQREVLGIYLSEHCDFHNTLGEKLRHRLVCGINDEQIQRRLLAESSLDFKKVMKLATLMEIAVKNARDLTPKMASGGDIQHFPALNRIDERQDNQHGPTATDCGRCGSKHDPQQSKFRDAECFLCHKKGHITRKCQSRPKGNLRTQRKVDTLALTDELFKFFGFSLLFKQLYN